MGRHAENKNNIDALNVLAKGGRSFYWASHFLGRKTAHDAAHLYAFCRTVDDLADGDIENGAARLAAINDQLSTLAAGQKPINPDVALQGFMPTLIACSVPIRPIQHLLDGLLFDQGEVLLTSEDELIKYAYQVAGTVGLLMCPILGCQDRHAFSFAVDMGIAMQLTNIARDVLEDAKMGRRYLPASWVGQLSASDIVASADVSDSIEAEQIKGAIDRLLSLADTYYASGRKGLVYLPMRAHIAIAVAANVYREIGQKLRRHRLNWAQGRVVTNKVEKAIASFGAGTGLPARIAGAKPVYRAGLQASLQGYLELENL